MLNRTLRCMSTADPGTSDQHIPAECWASNPRVETLTVPDRLTEEDERAVPRFDEIGRTSPRYRYSPSE